MPGRRQSWLIAICGRGKNVYEFVTLHRQKPGKLKRPRFVLRQWWDVFKKTKHETRTYDSLAAAKMTFFKRCITIGAKPIDLTKLKPSRYKSTVLWEDDERIRTPEDTRALRIGRSVRSRSLS